MQIIIIALIALVSLSADPGYAATRYVDNASSGCSSPDTDYNPATRACGSGSATVYTTIQAAHDAAALAAGDTIYVRGGTDYQPTVMITLTKDGSSGNRINLHAYPGETPVIDGINAVLGDMPFVVDLNGASWWHVKGLEITNGPSGGIDLQGASSNNIIELLNVHHNGRLDSFAWAAVVIRGTSANNLIINNDAHHNVDAGDGTNCDGFYGGQTTGTGNVMRGNRAWRNSDDGFDMFNTGGGNGAAWIMDNNWSFENGYDDNLDPLGEGNGFKLGGGGVSGGHTLRNNMAWRNGGGGFTDNGGDNPFTVYNNTAWDNVGHGYAFNAGGGVFHNNIDYSNCCAEELLAGSTESHNTWNGGVTVTDGDFQSLVFTGATGARQTDGSLPVMAFLRLVSSSDLVNAGTNVGLPFNGSAPDLGAQELGLTGGTGTLQLKVTRN